MIFKLVIVRMGCLLCQKLRTKTMHAVVNISMQASNRKLKETLKLN